LKLVVINSYKTDDDGVAEIWSRLVLVHKELLTNYIDRNRDKQNCNHQ